MMGWVFLGLAVATEILATTFLRMAAGGEADGQSTADERSRRVRRRWFIGVYVGYLISYSFLGLALREGIPLSVAYGIWSAVGVAVMAVIGRVVFKERLTAVMMLGIALISTGVFLIETGGH